MATDSSPRSLDSLATELASVARRAKTAAADASLTAELGTMGSELHAAAPPIAEATSVLYDSEHITLKPYELSELERRQAWLRDQLAAVLAQFHDDPTQIRRGTLWRDTKRAIEAVRDLLVTLRDDHYQTLLSPYPDEDAAHLASLLPHTPGFDDYERAITAFERALTTPPRSPADVERAITTGERLRDCRAQIESETVPAEFRTQWRQLRGTGLSLSDFTDEFRTWLRSRGSEDDVILRLRT